MTRPSAISRLSAPTTRPSSRISAPGRAVDLGELERVGAALGEPHQAEHEARDLRAAVQRGLARRRLAAAVAGRDGVLGEQRHEPVEVALADRPRRSARRAPRAARARARSAAAGPRRGGARGARAGGSSRASCRRSPRSRRSRSRTRRAAGTPRARPGVSALERDQQRHRDRLVVGPRVGRRSAPAATGRRRSRGARGPSAARRSTGASRPSPRTPSGARRRRRGAGAAAPPARRPRPRRRCPASGRRSRTRAAAAIS